MAEDVKTFTKIVKRGKYPIPKSIKISLNGLDFIDKCLRLDPNERLFGESL